MHIFIFILTIHLQKYLSQIILITSKNKMLYLKLFLK